MKNSIDDTLYVLDDEGRPVPCPDLIRWARWFEENFDQRQVARTEIGPKWVSTVFLGIDHNWGLRGPPIVFETMVFEDQGKTINFGGQDFPAHETLWMERSSDRDTALIMHAKGCQIAGPAFVKRWKLQQKRGALVWLTSP